MARKTNSSVSETVFNGTIFKLKRIMQKYMNSQETWILTYCIFRGKVCTFSTMLRSSINSYFSPTPFTFHFDTHHFILHSRDMSYFQRTLEGETLRIPSADFPNLPLLLSSWPNPLPWQRNTYCKMCCSITRLFTSWRTYTLIIQMWGGEILFIHQKSVGVEHNSAIVLAWRELRPCNAN